MSDSLLSIEERQLIEDTRSVEFQLGESKTRVKELEGQLLRLINCSASLLAHTPDFPALSDGGTAQEFLKGEIKRARAELDKLKGQS